MKKQMDVWEGIVHRYQDEEFEDWDIGSSHMDDVPDTIMSLEGKKVRVTIEVIE